MGQVYAIGASGISQWESGFYANIKDSEVYMQSMEDSGIPFEREYHLTDRERALRWLIESVMCKDGFDWEDWLAYPNLEKQIDILKDELEPALVNLEKQDLLKVTNTGFRLTERGIWLQRVVAAGLDPLMKGGTEKTFSKVL
jgi:coproporphyrinogen III oxidase-like Fe-S oxidoreductase